MVHRSFATPVSNSIPAYHLTYTVHKLCLCFKTEVFGPVKLCCPCTLTPPPNISSPCSTITTLYVGGLTAQITEEDIKEQLSKYGDVMNVRIVYAKNCAFVTFGTRSAAEAAAAALHNKLIIKGVRCRILWGTPQRSQQVCGTQSDSCQA